MCTHFVVHSGHLNKIRGGEWFLVLRILTCASRDEWKGVDWNACKLETLIWREQGLLQWSECE